ncbi:hypothetical protein ACQKPX_08780 [Photobacterium sp. DNB23_23_1]|uniref:50S ribosomal protein L20 n=1 Tax=Photobacterium pectinilyticum TaxID=2906793 RepID=A0ABT1MX34_9GAMM|nr:hypothetical protein [Photobacterium sp. ZSDE20]MCQ1057051.1 hypothetical protein [Photobacterium sp. ZSDE20]MDD1821186.1 hypothetical protein [Photobacterium sp. ZSDE20]
MRFSNKKISNNMRMRIASAATRRKRLNANTRKKILWRQRSYIINSSAGI